MRIAVCFVLALAPLAGQAEEPEALKRALPRLPATAATDAVATFRLAQGFRVELVASEPHVCSPVDMAFDEDGRLWVVEMIDYPYDERDGVPPEGRIQVLEDDDGDGRFGRSFVFADQLRWPTGLCLWDGGVFSRPRRTSCISRTPTVTTRRTARRSSSPASAGTTSRRC